MSDKLKDLFRSGEDYPLDKVDEQILNEAIEMKAPVEMTIPRFDPLNSFGPPPRYEGAQRVGVEFETAESVEFKMPMPTRWQRFKAWFARVILRRPPPPPPIAEFDIPIMKVIEDQTIRDVYDMEDNFFLAEYERTRSDD